MNILVLAAGGSETYALAGYSFPKNLVEIENRPLLQRVLENLSPLRELGGKFHIILRREECLSYHTDQMVKLLDPEARVVLSPSNTSGAACTALLATEYIDNDEPLLIANGDQLLLHDHIDLVKHFLSMKWDGGIPFFDDVHPRYSFVKLGSDNLVIEAAEKRPISRNASAGRYFFQKGSTFIRCAKNMILKNAHIEGVFYVCPVYNELVLEGGCIGVSMIPRDHYVNLSTPAGLHDFVNHYQHSVA
jgi:NDP-sugar pyrophosphorylase family protein